MRFKPKRQTIAVQNVEGDDDSQNLNSIANIIAATHTDKFSDDIVFQRDESRVNTSTHKAPSLFVTPDVVSRVEGTDVVEGVDYTAHLAPIFDTTKFEQVTPSLIEFFNNPDKSFLLQMMDLRDSAFNASGNDNKRWNEAPSSKIGNLNVYSDGTASILLNDGESELVITPNNLSSHHTYTVCVIPENKEAICLHKIFGHFGAEEK